VALNTIAPSSTLHNTKRKKKSETDGNIDSNWEPALKI
jgi:hypothetical protein